MSENNKIDWTILECYDDAGDGHCFFHHAIGEDLDGRKYTATAVMVDGSLEEIEDIEEEQ
jgi:hypothetical protein